MNFTNDAYADLLDLLRKSGYAFSDYHGYEERQRCVILRHDIDQSVDRAAAFARIEHEAGVKATYFVLLTSEFYNAASLHTRETLQEIQRLGHEIGLHFDEMAYRDRQEEVPGLIVREAQILSELLRTPVTTVSMHRPSPKTLEADYEIPGMVNSYGKTFFRDFKYLSDSRRRWREPVEEVIRSGQYDRLHILTHAFWYQQTEEPIQATVKHFVTHANAERYDLMRENITDLESIVKRSEVC